MLNRRAFLASTAAVAATPAGAQAATPPDAMAQMAAARASRTTSRALAEAALARAEAAQPQLNFATLIDRAGALARADAVPPGVVLLPSFIKDLNDFKGLPTSQGSRAFAGAAPASASEPFVEGFVRMNVNPMGKAATPEFGLVCTTEPLSHGATRNPWDPSLSPGGSSGGSAAAVAAGVVAIAHASDGGGSIRIPAALTGLFGFKPSRSRLAGQPKTDEVGAIAVEHVLTRSVRDSALVVASLQGDGAVGLGPPVPVITGPGAEKLRIGVITATADGTVPDAEVMAAIAATRALLTRLGHSVLDVDWPMNPTQFRDDFLNWWSLGAAQEMAGVNKRFGADGVAKLEPFTRFMASRVTNFAPPDIGALLGRMGAMRDKYNASFTTHDLLLTPVLTQHKLPLGYIDTAADGAATLARMMSLVAYTPVQNLVGAPAMNVPINWTATGLPVGVQLAGRRGDDARLLQLAFQLEAAAPWAQRRPPLWFG